MQNEDHTTITFRLPAAMRKQLDALAKAEDITASQLVRRHLRSLVPSTAAKKKGAAK